MFPCALLLTLATPRLQYELEAYQPAADEAATVVSGNARFTVLSPRLLRIEYSAAADFEDRPTLAFVNRKQPVPRFTWDATTGMLTTDYLQLVYTGGAFTATSLKVVPSPTSKPSVFKGWSFGTTSATDAGNLRGTLRTLDRKVNVSLDCNQLPSSDHCAWGVISRSGWALVNETGVPILAEDDWWADATGTMIRNKDTHDLYLFAHGHDYMGALSDLTKVGGRVPILPRRNLGVWFTRWYDYDAADVRGIIADFEQRALPLDILVLDMNWHMKNDWTGYTFDDTLFGNPKEVLDWLHAKGLHVAANLHDADGINPWEAQYASAAAAMGLPTTGGAIPLSLTNKSYVFALEDAVLGPVEELGMDFWWIDWQQGETKGNTGQDGRPDGKMNPTIWTAKARVTDSLRRCRMLKKCTNKRGVTFARWGGLGQHRYQHGFSGDVSGLTWSNLAYQAYFSATASNVGFGFWSHDLVGPGTDHEMYVRWLQLGSYSGVMRMHDRGGSAGGCMPWPSSDAACWTVRPWNLPLTYYEAAANALRTRARLLPYIYTQARVAFDTGLGLTRPMYYYFPEDDGAYPATMDANLGQLPSSRQYFFGHSLLVAPVTVEGVCVAGIASDVAAAIDGQGAVGAVAPSPPPPDAPCGLATMDVWLPPGSWFEIHTGRLLGGKSSTASSTRSISVHLFDVPVYAKGGAVIPHRPLDTGKSTVGLSADAYEEIEWTVYPGATAGQATVYEDDGQTYTYLKGAFTNTVLSYTRSTSALNVNITMHVNGDGYSSMPTVRRHTVKVPNSLPPTSVLVNASTALPWSRYGGPGTWFYNGDDVELVVNLPSARTRDPIQVSIDWAIDSGSFPLYGLKGKMAAARRAKANLNLRRMAPGEKSGHVDPRGAPLAVVSSTPERLSSLARDAAAFRAMVSNVSATFSTAAAEVSQIAASCKADVDKLRALYSSAILQAAMA